MFFSPQLVYCTSAYCLLPPKNFGIDNAGVILRPCDYNLNLST